MSYVTTLLSAAWIVLAGCADDDASGAFDTRSGTDATSTSDAATASSDSAAGAACDLNPSDPQRFVIVGFWRTTDCSGEPVNTNAFPVDNGGGCYCWPGHSGENSADSFSCDPANGAFTYTQYGSLTCGAGDNTPQSKTVNTTDCRQDIPPTLYSRIVDYGACAL